MRLYSFRQKFRVAVLSVVRTTVTGLIRDLYLVLKLQNWSFIICHTISSEDMAKIILVLRIKKKLASLASRENFSRGGSRLENLS